MTEEKERPTVTIEEMMESTVKLIGESAMISRRLAWDNPKLRAMADMAAMDLRGWRDQMSKDEYVLFTFAKAIHDTALMATGLGAVGYHVPTIMHTIDCMSVIPQIILELLNEECTPENMAELGLLDPEVGE